MANSVDAIKLNDENLFGFRPFLFGLLTILSLAYLISQDDAALAY